VCCLNLLAKGLRLPYKITPKTTLFLPFSEISMTKPEFSCISYFVPHQHLLLQKKQLTSFLNERITGKYQRFY
jgi:hypothetical protein